MLDKVIDIAAVNALSVERFVECFGDIAEHSPWVAGTAAATRPFAEREAMIAAFCQAVMSAPQEQQFSLLRAHPDLAGKAALAGALTTDSTQEQAGAGLDSLTAAEFDRFTTLNSRYLERFGFPFIFAVKGANKYQILDAFEDRIDQSPEREFQTALQQVCRILRFRLEDKVAA